MASIPIGKISLIDNWPGPVNPWLSIPSDGWDGTTHSCVTVPAYPLGTKIMAYSDASINPGWYTMMYVEVASVCDGGINTNGGPERDVSEGSMFMGHADMTQPASDLTYNITTHDGSHPPPTFVVHSCYSSMTDFTKGSGRFGVMCATINGYGHGWMWIAGVCPVGDVSLFRGLNDAAAGAEITIATNISGRRLFVADTTAYGLILTVCPTEVAHTLDGTHGHAAGAHIGWCDAS